MIFNVNDLDENCLFNVAKTTMSSKIIGAESDFFSKIVVNAMKNVKTEQKWDGKIKYPIKNVHILKKQGKSSKESQLVDGYALNITRASQQMPKYIKNAKIALLDIGLNKQKVKFGVSVDITNPEEIEAIQKKEIDLVIERIKMVLKSGANIILTTKGIDDIFLKYFVEAGTIACRRCDKEDLKRIAKVTGATLITSFVNINGEESFESNYLGESEEVIETRIADDELIYIKKPKNTKCQSIILRGPNEFMLDEMERSLHDSICVLSKVLESKTVVPGGGACETAVTVFLERFANNFESREQLAITEFAQALLVIPKTLAINAACDATDLTAKLMAMHYKSQTSPDNKNLKNYGLDLIEGKVKDNVKQGVLEPSLNKIKCLQFATEAAITILRIDDLIRLNPKKKDQR